ncbi:MAG: acyltransferase family protein [Spirochaetia bacterium]|jgi:peptidoglycan/LPS O-acetylase OafA/YrhL
MSVTSARAGVQPMASLVPASRLFFLDTLRIFLTVLVIAHHVGQAYGPTGGYWPVQEQARAAILGPFFTVNRSFFMSLFFMISGYFMVGAYQRNGFAGFLKGRLVRLGVPVFAFAALMLPSRIFLFGEHISRWDDYFNAGHLWYLEHLLLFSVLYALWRRIREGKNAPQSGTDTRRPAPGFPVTFAALLLVAVACGAVRIWSPIDRWMNILGFFRVAFADVPRDLAFFIFGAVAFRRGWFESFPFRRGMIWLAVGLAAAAVRYALSLIPLPHEAIGGPALGIAYLVWEELVCFGMCIGLLALFRQTVKTQGPLGRWLAANQYSAYFWHPLLIVPIQMVFLSLPLDPLVKFVVVTAIGVPVVFLWSRLVRAIPAVRAVL